MPEDQVQTPVDVLLADAASGIPGAAAEFFKELLKSDVYVPLKLSGEKRAFPELGSGQAIKESCIIVRHEGKEILPIFTQEAFVDSWSERALPKGKLAFKALLWLISDSIWLYLNPGQDFGKEFSPWEASKLREGPEAIADIVQDMGEAVEALEVEVVRDTALFPELKAALVPIFEVYPAVEEARMVGIKDSESEALSPLLKITHSGLTPEKLEILRLELQEAAEQLLPFGIQMTITTDALDEQGVYEPLFADIVPFYIVQKPWPPQGTESTEESQ